MESRYHSHRSINTAMSKSQTAYANYDSERLARRHDISMKYDSVYIYLQLLGLILLIPCLNE